MITTDLTLRDRLEMEYDYVIEKGTVIDPKTEKRTIASVGIKDDKIVLLLECL